MKGKVKILFYDKSNLIINNLEEINSDLFDIFVINEVLSFDELVKILKSKSITVLVSNIDLTLTSSIEKFVLLKNEFTNLRIILYTFHHHLSIFNKLKTKEINAIISQNYSVKNLNTIIQEVLLGKKNYFYENPNSPKIKNLNLTKRELEIVKLLVLGNSNVEISKILFISDRTVDTHRTNIMRKINVHNIAGLIRYVYQNNLLNQ